MSSAEKALQEVKVYRISCSRGQYDWSPFVTKLELRLRASGITYTTEAGSRSAAPKGKIPYLELRKEDMPPTTYSDSTLIIKNLIEIGEIEDWNGSLGASEKAFDLSTRAMLEDKLYFYHTRERWLDNYYEQRDNVLSSIPYPVRIIVGLLAHRQIKATLHGQGTGRFSADEIRASREEIWETINGLLEHSSRQSRRQTAKGDPFWCLEGSGPTEADTTLYGFIISVLVATCGPESQRLVKSFPTVLDYATRIHVRYFPDYEVWT